LVLTDWEESGKKKAVNGNNSRQQYSERQEMRNETANVNKIMNS
jgi:hypothetical protein